MHFEFIKNETSNENTQDLRDYRITNNTLVLSEFISDLSNSGMTTRISWAAARATPTSISSPGAPPPPTNLPGSGSSQSEGGGTRGPEGVIITATTRPRDTQFPSLFGTSEAWSQRDELVELSVVIFSVVLGGWVVMRNL